MLIRCMSVHATDVTKRVLLPGFVRATDVTKRVSLPGFVRTTGVTKRVSLPGLFCPCYLACCPKVWTWYKWENQ